jgi:hypothetical protein
MCGARIIDSTLTRVETNSKDYVCKIEPVGKMGSNQGA